MNDAIILPSSPVGQAKQPRRDLSTDRDLISPDSRFKTDDEVVTLVDDAKTFVTSERLSDDDSFDDDDGVSPQDELDDDSGGHHVPVEVNVSYDIDDDDSFEDVDDDDASSTSSEASEHDDEDDDEVDESDYESECMEENDDTLTEADDDSCYSSRSDSERRHELFLPLDTSPTYEKLKYDTEDEDSDDEEEELPSVTSRRTLTTCNRSFRPRRMMMLMPPKRLYERHASPSSISITSSSSEDSTSIRTDDSKQSISTSRRPGVSFDNTVAVYPVFETDVYPPSMIRNMYTNREELRVNKLRNKREFAYDDNDWRNATEECDMQSDEDGELVHPVHTAKRTFTRGPFLSNVSASIWQPTGAGVVHRAKRMRMYYP